MKLIQSERSKSNSLNSSIDERHLDEPIKSCDEDIISSRKHSQEEDYAKDWCYERPRPATAGPAASRRGYATRAYGLFESPMDIELSDQDDRAEEGSCSDCHDEQYYHSCCPQSERRQIKRKTARPASASASDCMINKSLSESDAAGIYELYERVKNLAMRDCECNRQGARTSGTEPPYRIRGTNRCPSVIKTPLEPPHTRNLVKTVPWKRHQMYLRMWKAQPVVGEDQRFQLRKETQAKMLQKEEIKMPRRVYKPNTYVPPTENPRYKLRWEVRLATANYEMPGTSKCT
ncbi:hypothetical protein EGW08_021769 [Elysia chlorotica]|uniref:Centriolar and ciliogenesis-associated protein HYLS1 C-terminal domain-containing protein n=1 Tax=Elysia chlorotica TaxID=188477 RepID=A0A3S0Z4F8_ELYCH|nr:hypothetical protein EGW08_021769 [Elysia chlorotica]